MGLEDFLSRLKFGYSVGDYIIKAGEVVPGRFVEEYNLQLKLFHRGMGKDFMYMKIFLGRAPYYFPWIEIFNISNHLEYGETKVSFFGSEFEDFLFREIYVNLPNGSHIFVEYISDEETRRELTLDVPPPFTRLGFKLLSIGFTWFKDWYFPEGQNEGNPKLQAEKPLNEFYRKKHLGEIEEEAKNFLLELREVSSLKAARDRAKEALELFIPMFKENLNKLNYKESR